MARGADALQPLRDELQQLRRYLAVEKVCFGDRLSLSEQIDDQCLDLLVPPLLLQPLVENVLKHGIAELVDRVSSRPDFSVLVYAGVSTELLELVTADSPPAFIVPSHEDGTISPKQSLLFYEALLENGVQADMHVFGRGVHGSGMAPGDPALGQWPTLLARWLRTSGFLTSAQRVAVKGAVTIDGEHLLWGCVTFIPEDPNTPIARVYSGGEFRIDTAHGPVPGPHRVEVHILSKDFSDLKSGKHSMDDVERYTKASPYAATMTGDYDPESKTIHWMTEAKDPNGNQMVQKTSVTQEHANERVLVLMVPGEKKDDFTKFMQINFVKRK